MDAQSVYVKILEVDAGINRPFQCLCSPSMEWTHLYNFYTIRQGFE